MYSLESLQLGGPCRPPIGARHRCHVDATSPCSPYTWAGQVWTPSYNLAAAANTNQVARADGQPEPKSWAHPPQLLGKEEGRAANNLGTSSTLREPHPRVIRTPPGMHRKPHGCALAHMTPLLSFVASTQFHLPLQRQHFPEKGAPI